MKNKDIRMALVLMIMFIILYGVTYTFQSSNVLKTHTTAAFFPRVVLIIAMFFTLLIIAENLIKGADVSEQKTLDKEKLKRVLISMGLTVLLGFGASYLGTFVSIFLFIVAIMLAWGVRDKKTILLNAIITPIVVYLIFTKILLVQFPSGILR